MDVKIYSTPSCGFCKMAKAYFGENNIEYIEIDVSEDAEAAEEMQTKSGQLGVPVIVVTKDDGTEEILVGFEKPKLEAALGLSA